MDRKLARGVFAGKRLFSTTNVPDVIFTTLSVLLGTSKPHCQRDAAALGVAPRENLDAIIGSSRNQEARRFPNRCAD